METQGAKKIIFKTCHLDKLNLEFTSPDVISTSPKSFLISRINFCYSNSSKKITCPSGKLKTEFTCPIAESTSPGLSDTTFFACWDAMFVSLWGAQTWLPGTNRIICLWFFLQMVNSLLEELIKIKLIIILRQGMFR